MKRLPLVLMVGLALCAWSCAGNDAPPPAAASGELAAPDERSAETAPQIANPASVHCEERGGRLELLDQPSGTVGVCVFDDGSRCEEWRFWRGECAPGRCFEPDGGCPKAR